MKLRLPNFGPLRRPRAVWNLNDPRWGRQEGDDSKPQGSDEQRPEDNRSPEKPRQDDDRRGQRPQAGPPQVNQSRTGELAASITGIFSGRSWGSQ